MVLGATNQSKTIKSEAKVGHAMSLALLGIFVATLTTVGMLLVKPSSDVREDIVEKMDEAAREGEALVEPEFVTLPARIDFQPLVDEWAKSVNGNRSVMIYDLERDEVVGEYNVTEKYSTASLYKLFVVYEGYRRVQSGEWQSDDPAGSTGYTVLECLDLAIRESYSPCAETLWNYIGRDSLNNIIVNDFEIVDSDLSHLISNPVDVMRMMRVFYWHKDITDEVLIARMKDSFINQPATEYNWRQGLPSGFTRANVYNKVGWDYDPDDGRWNVYHDAAIVEFPEENRHFVVVVMTSQVPFQRIRELGAAIEAYF